MNVVFLDIDGVLNNDVTKSKTPMGFTGINNNLLKRLACLTKTTNAVVVLSSTWKDEWNSNPMKRTEDGEYLQKKFNQCGICIADKIDDHLTGVSHRGAAIKLYLDKYKNIENYVILDDFEFDFATYEIVQNHFVKTNPTLGFTKENLKEALKIMGNK